MSVVRYAAGRGRRLVVAGVAVAVLAAGCHAGGPGPAAGSSSGPPSGNPTVEQTSGQVAPGLPRGTAPVNGLANENLYGTPVGYPHTLDGAISAALNYDAHGADPVYILDDTAMKLAKRTSATEDMAQAFAAPSKLAKVRASIGINAQGQPVDPAAGKVDPTRRFISGGEARYGAFRVLDVVTDGSGLAKVTLDIYTPAWQGIGSDADMTGVVLDTRAVNYVMAWGPGPDGGPVDWRILDSPSGVRLSIDPPRTSNPGFDALARALFGQGWMVPADATMDKLPGAMFTR